MKKVIIICGAPCSGKGTQSGILADKKGYKHVSTGDLIRNSDRDDLKAIIATGNLVSDAQMLEVLEDQFRDGQSIILDGYPRTRQQFVNLIDVMDRYGYKLESVIYVMVSGHEVRRRMAGRNHGRTDDTAEKFEVRLSKFYESTEKVIETYLSCMPHFLRVDGERPADVVGQEIEESLLPVEQG
jgi:adenylate kinase